MIGIFKHGCAFKLAMFLCVYNLYVYVCVYRLYAFIHTFSFVCVHIYVYIHILYNTFFFLVVLGDKVK